MYQLVAILTYARKANNRKEQVIAVGTQKMLAAESKRWRKVAAEWAKTHAGKAKVKPSLTIEMREL